MAQIDHRHLRMTERARQHIDVCDDACRGRYIQRSVGFAEHALHIDDDQRRALWLQIPADLLIGDGHRPRSSLAVRAEHNTRPQAETISSVVIYE